MQQNKLKLSPKIVEIQLVIKQHITAVIKLDTDGYLRSAGLTHNEEEADDDD